MDKKFRLPRKIKKQLSHEIWLYPMDETTQTSLMAWPCKYQEDYTAYKLGIIKNIMD